MSQQGTTGAPQTTLSRYHSATRYIKVNVFSGEGGGAVYHTFYRSCQFINVVDRSEVEPRCKQDKITARENKSPPRPSLLLTDYLEKQERSNSISRRRKTLFFCFPGPRVDNVKENIREKYVE